jgi:hypothetical protein
MPIYARPFDDADDWSEIRTPDDLDRWFGEAAKRVRELPPWPMKVVVVEAEIPGGWHRMWRSDGRMVVYLSGSAFDSFPLVKVDAPPEAVHLGRGDVAPYVGIPVYDERSPVVRRPSRAT